MKDDRRKIANSFYLPKHPFLYGISGLMDFTGSATREYTEQLLARSVAESMRADWESVGASLWWAIDEHEKELLEGSIA